MKIAAVALKNFRAYEDAEVSFDEPLSIVRGANHSGKSSLAQAIQLSLTKRAEGTDPRGAGASDKIRTGASKAIIDLTVNGKSGPVEVKTTYSGTGRTQKLSVEAFSRYIEVNSDRLSCCLDSEYFTGLKPEQQKAVLGALVLPTSYEFPIGIREVAGKHLGPIVWEHPPVTVIDYAYKLAYDARKDAKARLNTIWVQQTPEKPEFTGDEIREQLNKLREAAKKETAKLKRTGTAQIGKLEAELEHANAVLENALQVRKDAIEKRDEQYGLLLKGPTEKKYRDVAAGRERADQIVAKMGEATVEIDDQRNAQELFEEMRNDPVCPTCVQPITDAFIDGKIAEHRKLEEAAAQRHMELLRELKELGDIEGAEKALRQNAETLKLHKASEIARVEADDAIHKINLDIKRIQHALEQATAQQEAPPDTSVLDGLNSNIAELEGLLGPVANYESTLIQIKQAEELKVKWESIVADLEMLCEYFGKDGIKAELIGEHIANFSQTVNRTLATWGYQAAFSMEPYEFTVNGMPLKELSDSEKLMFGVAMQCAIAVHSGMRMVLIDRADTFINGERGRLFGCAKLMLDRELLDQAIILVSGERTEVPEQEGVGFYRVADGKVLRL